MKRLPVRKRLSKPLASVATCASRQGNYHFRLANVFASLFLPSRIFIIKQFFCKIYFMFNFKKLEFRANRKTTSYFDFFSLSSSVSSMFSIFLILFLIEELAFLSFSIVLICSSTDEKRQFLYISRPIPIVVVSFEAR